MILSKMTIGNSPNKAKRRIFIALPISGRLQEEILEWEKQFQNLPVRWLQGKNLHITLVPPWYEEDLEKIKDLLRQVENFGAINLAFEKVTFGPDSRRPRLIWAEGEVSQELLGLQKKVFEVLRNRDPKLQIHTNLQKRKPNKKEFVDSDKFVDWDRLAEKRPLKLHLTLARFRPQDFSSFPVKKLDEKVDWRDRADRVVLFESYLSREGADYQILSEVILS